MFKYCSDIVCWIYKLLVAPPLDAIALVLGKRDARRFEREVNDAYADLLRTHHGVVESASPPKHLDYLSVYVQFPDRRFLITRGRGEFVVSLEQLDTRTPIFSEFDLSHDGFVRALWDSARYLSERWNRILDADFWESKEMRSSTG